jgi:adenylyltransferase/sulfurtransferase
LRIVDRDFVETSNLQRQVLYDEQDVRDRLPKAVAAATKLRQINSSIHIEEHVEDINADTIGRLGQGIDVILDGTDNFETRLLINDYALEHIIPWVNGACISTHGQVRTIIPGRTACYRCLVPDLPEPGSVETCDTAGVLAPTVHVVAALQAAEAMKLLTGHYEREEPMLTVVDIWEGTWRRLSLASLAQRDDCPACGRGERSYLRGESGSRNVVLCGRNAVQLSPPARGMLSLDQLAARWATLGEVQSNPYLTRLKLADQGVEITVFRDGRAIVQGTQEPSVARSVYARYVGT